MAKRPKFKIGDRVQFEYGKTTKTPGKPSCGDVVGYHGQNQVGHLYTIQADAIYEHHRHTYAKYEHDIAKEATS